MHFSLKEHFHDNDNYLAAVCYDAHDILPPPLPLLLHIFPMLTPLHITSHRRGLTPPRLRHAPQPWALDPIQPALLIPGRAIQQRQPTDQPWIWPEATNVPVVVFE